MTCFFMVVFSIPFFIPSTYKAYLSELQPFCDMFDTIQSDPLFYWNAMDHFITIQWSFPDYIIYMDAPDFHYEDPDYTDNNIWTIDQISTTFNDKWYKFIYNFHRTVKIYAGVEILAFISIVILLIFFVLMINADVVKFVVLPLEQMFEKV